MSELIPAPTLDGQSSSEAASTHVQPRRRGRSAEQVWDVAALADFRAVAYQIFAAALLPPTTSRIGWLRSLAEELEQYHESVAELAFFGSWQQLMRTLRALAASDTRTLEEEYVRLFVGSGSDAPCYPYEAQYVASGHDVGWVISLLETTYTQAGLRLSPTLRESPDHVAVELEYLAFLCTQEAAGWEAKTTDVALRALGRQRAFLRLHLGKWFGAFAAQVCATTTEPLYNDVLLAVEEFIHHDQQLAELLGRQIRHLQADNEAANGDDNVRSERPQ